MRSLRTSPLRLGLACLIALAACGDRTKEPPPASRNQPPGAPAPTDTRTNPHPTAQPANSGTPGPSAGAANPSNVHTPDPGHEPPGGVPGAASPDKPAPTPSQAH
ncbi:hypothetical protein [Nannocystis pusilla]|uniref:hypothetical protein n=1 Tax=Nannocystis pusilla TaxID=889268 RepID=UPI003BF30346